jgi:predicted thioesterase
MKDTLVVGVTGEKRHRVVSENLVSHYHPQGPPVFGTPFLLLVMEGAAFNAILPHLDEGEQSVGVGFNFEHLAPTLPGATVVARAEVREIDGNKITVQFEAHDGKQLIGRGTHVRAVLDMERFKKRLRRLEG